MWSEENVIPTFRKDSRQEPGFGSGLMAYLDDGHEICWVSCRIFRFRNCHIVVWYFGGFSPQVGT